MNTMPHEIILENLHLDVNDYHSILEIYYFLGGYKDAFAVIEGRVAAKLPDKGYFFIRLDVSFEIADKLLYIDLAGVDDDEPYTDFEERIWLFDVQPFEDAGIVVGDYVQFTALVFAYYRSDGQVAFSLKCPKSIHKFSESEVPLVCKCFNDRYCRNEVLNVFID